MERVLGVLIVGVSTRAAAESAARAGFTVTAIDAFGDLDQHPSVRVVSLEGAFTARAAARAARAVKCEAVVYLANFENHPRAVSALAEGRALWGNPPEVIRRVRDPVLLAEVLRKRGFAVPETYVVSGFPPSRADEHTARFGVAAPELANRRAKAGSRTDSVREWLVKPIASGGGQRIRRWQRGEALPRGCYVQQLIDGPPGSVVFVAAGGRAVLLGISRQLVGEQAFGAAGYQYCGNILAEEDVALVDTATALARAVTEEFGLVGVNGIDFIVRDGVPYAIEVNPRWCASMELVERAYGLSVLGTHAAACASGMLPDFDLNRERSRVSAVGKAVVFARRDVVVGATDAWLPGNDAGDGDALRAIGSVRDIPPPGARIAAGRPVCTVFATGRDSGMCHEALVGCAGQIYAQLDAWERGIACAIC